MYWSDLTDMVFSVPGHFELQQYVFDAGRPVVVAWGNHTNTPHFVNKFLCMPSGNEDMAVLGIVVIFGIEHVEIAATVGTYKLFFDSDAPTLSQASRGL